MKQLGRISFTDADAIDRAINHNSVERPERRHQFRIRKPEPETNVRVFGHVCEGCNLRRTDREFGAHRLCNVCRGKGKC